MLSDFQVVVNCFQNCIFDAGKTAEYVEVYVTQQLKDSNRILKTGCSKQQNLLTKADFVVLLE